MDWHKYFQYDPIAGDIVWKVRSEDDFPDMQNRRSWNARYAGKRAGATSTSRGGSVVYRTVGITTGKKARFYLVHRIIWEMHNGPIPDGMQVDHVNTDSLDNKITNLRLATHAQNLWNRGAEKCNTLGLKGVTPDRRRGKWKATIRANKGIHNLGYFDSPDEAHAAYRSAALVLHGEFARTQDHQEIADASHEKKTTHFQGT